MLERQTVRLACSRARVSAGRSMPMRTAMMPMTTRSSTSVKARLRVMTLLSWLIVTLRLSLRQQKAMQAGEVVGVDPIDVGLAKLAPGVGIVGGVPEAELAVMSVHALDETAQIGALFLRHGTLATPGEVIG